MNLEKKDNIGEITTAMHYKFVNATYNITIVCCCISSTTPHAVYHLLSYKTLSLYQNGHLHHTLNHSKTKRKV